jgi:uncharacterized protein YggE
MKHLIIAVTLLLVAGSHAQSDTPLKTIVLRSAGEVETLPDMATFRINLSCLKASVKAAKNCLVEQSNTLSDQLLASGIEKDDILTTSVTLNKSYTWQNNSRVFEGYKSATSLQVKVRDLDALDEVYTELLETRNLDLSGLSYDHSQMDSLRNQAYINALKKAHALADTLLSELPESGKEILKISNVHIASSSPYRQRSAQTMMMADSKAAEQSVAIHTGTIKVTATLYVEYRIR